MLLKWLRQETFRPYKRPRDITPNPSQSNSCRTCHISQQTTSKPTRARNLSARYAHREDPPTSTPSLDNDPVQVKGETKEASQIGLSSQGLGNPKSVQAAARLSEYASGAEGRVPPSKTQRNMAFGDLSISIPEKPAPPGPEDCCMSGCAVCVHDLYIDALQSYTASLRHIRDTLSKRAIPQQNWPSVIWALKDDSDNADDEGVPSDLDPATRAFMMLERELKKKKQA
ncbi:hypothetical protein FRB96_006878 [Tulasnella sp. 330]|nr:hypothetical protein FRB96_006878 [Tulasnella sp. 330]KAG8874098.1 hypothetical protein FRB97_006164 [Tulasnella sp. 331]KAG8889365.1 hypothetical protein FRB98_004649 [Tulasnella sp. 332]